ncbi:MAG: sugar phosphate isomerase/epimerase [Chlamydiales bacterium]
MTQPGIPNHLVLSTSCYGSRLKTIEDQAFAAVAMGFRRLELGLSEIPVPLSGWEDSRRETGICVDSVVVGSLNPRMQNMSGSRLGAMDAEERERALNSSRRHIRLAQRLQAPIVVVRGCEVEDKRLAAEGEALAEEMDLATLDTHDAVAEKVRDYVHRVQKKGQRQLEHFCRSLHTLNSEFPDTRIAIEPGLQFNDLLNFEAMEWTLDDLSKLGLGYWHDTGRIQMRERAGLPGQGQWLDSFASRMLGVHLQDAAEGQDELPPGQGEVDFRLVCEYLPAEAVRVVEMNERHGRAAILASVHFLIEQGF